MHVAASDRALRANVDGEEEEGKKGKSQHGQMLHTHTCKEEKKMWKEGVPTDNRADVRNPKQTPSVSHYEASALAPRMSTFHKYYLGLAKAAGQKPECCSISQSCIRV